MITSSHLYVWNDIPHRSMVASGLRFADFEPALQGKGGLLLLRHRFKSARTDTVSGLEYVDRKRIPLLAKTDVYPWGDFYWADYSGTDFPNLTAEAIEELSYFSTEALPKKTSRIEPLGNDLLVAAHDDGWYARVFYSDWDSVARIVRAKAPELSDKNLDHLRRGASAFWVQDGEVRAEEKTFDVDVVLNRNLKRKARAKQVKRRS